MKAFLLLCLFGLAVPVSAQGQSPTSPRPLPSGLGQPSTTQPGAAQPGLGSAAPSSLQGGATPGANGTGTAGRADTPTRPTTGAAGGGVLGEPASGAPAPRTTTRAPRSGATTGGAGRTLGGSAASGAGGGEGAKLQPAPPPSLQVIGDGAFEPAFDHPLPFPDLPDEGESLTLAGPIPLAEFMTEIGLATGWNILISETAQGLQLQYFNIVDMRPRIAMEVVKFHGGIFYEYRPETSFLYVMTREDYLVREFGAVKPLEFQVLHADMEYITTAMTALKSAVGRLIVDSRTRRIYVWDTADNLAHMQKMVSELDVELEMREFRVNHTEFADAEGLLISLLSPNGSFLSDPRTGSFTIWDAPLSLDRMAQAMAQLDVPLFVQILPIKHVYADDVAEYLDSALLISERGIVQVDPRSNTLIITDRPERIKRMEDMIAQLDVPLETRTWVIKYADLDFVAGQVEAIIPPEMGEIVINDPVRQITVTGQPGRLDQIDELISTWDIHRRQVTIEVYFVDVNSDVERQFNINWSYFDMQGGSPVIWNGGTGFNSSGSSPVTLGQLPYQVPAYGDLQLTPGGGIERPLLRNLDGSQVIDHFGGKSLAATIDYLEQQNKAQVLNSPRVTVVDGEPAIFNNATRVPYTEQTTSFQNTFSSAGSAFNTNRISFIDVGTLLSVTPRITSDDRVLLEIGAEDSTFIMQEVTTNDQVSTVPQTTARRLETLVQVSNGETVVLGGLRRDTATKSVSRIPILGDLPGIGRIFRQPNRRSVNATLLIFITPTVVDDRTSPESTMLARVETEIADAHRHNLKSVWGRVGDLIAEGRNEFSVAVGRSGSLHADSVPVTLSELEDVFAALKSRNVTVLVRSHPSAPRSAIDAVTAAAVAAELRYKLDTSGTPLVPPVLDFEVMDDSEKL